MAICIFLLILLAIGIISKWRHQSSSTYASQGNLLAHFLPAFIGAEHLIGIPLISFQHGLHAVILLLALIIRDLFTIFIVMPVIQSGAKQGALKNENTSKTSKQLILNCAISFYLLAMLTIQLFGLTIFFHRLVPMDLGYAGLLSAALVLLFANFSRLNSQIFVRLFIFGFFSIALPVLFTFSMHLFGGYAGLISQLPKTKLLNPFSIGELDQVISLSLCWIFLLPDFNPHLFFKIDQFSAGSGQIKKALLTLTFARIPVFLMLFFLGLIAFILEPTLNPHEALLYLTDHILPTPGYHLTIFGFLTILIATTQSFLQSFQHLWLSNKERSKRSNILTRSALSLAVTSLAFLWAKNLGTVWQLFTFATALLFLIEGVPKLAQLILKTSTTMHRWIVAGLAFYAFGLCYCFVEGKYIWPWTLIGTGSVYILPISLRGFFPPLKEPSDKKSFRQLKADYWSNRFNLFRLMQSLVDWIAESSSRRVEIFGAPFGLFVFFGVANFCFVPFIFSDVLRYITPGFTIYLRFLASFISFVLIMKEFWPNLSKKYGALFWHMTLMLCLPHFGIAMCLFSSLAIEWVIDLILITFILGLLVDWKSYIAIMINAYALSFFSFWLLGDISKFNPPYEHLPIIIYAVTVSLVVGTIFSRNKEMVLIEKLDTFKALSSTIAHEMRTPLSSINLSAVGLKQCLPALIKTYHEAKVAGLKVPVVSKLAEESLANAPERMSYVCRSALNTIDMLLLQLRNHDWTNNFTTCSMADCIQTALREYSFRTGERELVFFDGKDFTFVGNKYLVVHILFNLLRNALTFIQSEKKGMIRIWITKGKKEMMLHFCDTAKGIKKKDLPLIFDHGFSKRSGGSGVGLFYCRRMMTAMKGNITVRSVEGQFAEFILHFPR